MATQNHPYISPLRYPGGKGQLANFMKLVIQANDLSDGEYVEVYAGGAGVALSLLMEEYVQHVHINDFDPAVHAFWHSVLNDTEELAGMITDRPVTMEEWYRQREVHQAPAGYHSTLELGFSTFYLNRCNRSGVLKAGVIGGLAQAGKWKLDVRYNKDDLVCRIRRIARFRHRISLYRQDAAEFIRDSLPTVAERALVYFDPPYYAKGQDLYDNHYTPDDHATMARMITGHVRQPWIVTYDLTPEIEALYAGQSSLRYRIGYTAQVKYTGAEVMYHSEGLSLPRGLDPAYVSRRDMKAYGKGQQTFAV